MKKKIALTPAELRTVELQLSNVLFVLERDRAVHTVEQRVKVDQESQFYTLSLEPFTEAVAADGTPASPPKSKTRREKIED